MAMDFTPSQPDKRRSTVYVDQHGRRWTAVIEIRNGQPCSPLTPMGWSAPLMPELHHMTFDPNQPGTVWIDYATWVQDREQAIRNYEATRIAAAQRLYADQAGRALKTNPPELQHLVGKIPEPVEPVVAAAQGNKWVLGMSPNKPDWAEKFFPEEEEVVRRMPVTEAIFAGYGDFSDTEEAEV